MITPAMPLTTSLNGLLSLAHLKNPFASIEILYQPNLYDPLFPQDHMHPQSTRRLEDGPPVPRTEAQLITYFADLVLDYQYPHVSHDPQFLASARHLPALVCLIPRYAQALHHVLTLTPVPTRPLTSPLLSRHDTQWAFVWPWLDESLRAALRPYLPFYCSEPVRCLLSLIDPAIPPPTKRSQWSVLAQWVTHDRPVTDADWHDALARILDMSPPCFQPMDGRLLLSYAPTGILDDYTESCHVLHDVMPLTGCQAASPALLRKVLSFTRTSVTESYPWWSYIPKTPMVATINPTTITARLTGRALLSALSTWAVESQLDAPNIVIEPTTNVLAMLREESVGPYADHATLIARRIPHIHSQPDWVRDLAMTPLPATYQAITDTLRSTELPIESLARCLHGTLLLYGTRGALHVVARQVMQHPSTTRALVLRGLQHPVHEIRMSTVPSLYLTEDEDYKFLALGDYTIAKCISDKRPLSPRMIKTLMRLGSFESRLLVAQQPVLSARVVARIYADGNAYIVEQLAASGHLTEAQLRRLMRSKSETARAIPARYGNAALCDVLSRDRTHHVTLYAALNPHATRETVEFLAKRHRKRLASVLVRHPNLSDQTRISLALLPQS